MPQRMLASHALLLTLVILLTAFLPRVSHAIYSGGATSTICYDRLAGCGICGRKCVVVEGTCDDYELNPDRNTVCYNHCLAATGCPAGGDVFTSLVPFLDFGTIIAELGGATVVATGSGPLAYVRTSASPCASGVEYAILPEALDLDLGGLLILQVISPGDTVSYPPFAPIEFLSGSIAPAGPDFYIAVTQLNPQTHAIMQERLLPVVVADLAFQPGLACALPPASDIALQVQPSDWLQDAFPFNETAGLAGTAAFDTATVLVKTGRNIAPLTGTELRFDIPGDSLVAASCDTASRMDLVFRILPGPGNYKASLPRSHSPGGGTPTGSLLRSPTDQSTLASVGDGSFWGEYLAANGAFGTSGGHTGGVWDPNVWNSARMDTAESNLFPVQSLGDLSHVSPCLWSATYHESDPKFTTLGIPKFRCLVVDTSKAATSTAVVNNVVCNGSVPAWLSTVPGSRTGWNGVNTSREYTKILPDGLFTPGTHIQYFIRRSRLATPTTFQMLPDTGRVSPQSGVHSVTCLGDRDGHRWMEFSAVPDRWKDPNFGGVGGSGMLSVTLDDQGGDERAWASIADRLGATQPAKFGANNGWHTPTSDANPNLTTNFVRSHGGQAGTTWDQYHVRGAADALNGHAGSLGSRLANRTSMGFAAGKYARNAPTPEMLRVYYPMLLLQSGGLRDRVLGPVVDRSQDDIAILNDYLTNAAGTPQPRGIWIQGDGFVESETRSGGLNAAHTQFLQQKLGLSLRNEDYSVLSGNTADCVALHVAGPGGADGLFGVNIEGCETLDLLQRNPGIVESYDATYYENIGVNGPYVASVGKPSTPSRNWVALTDGWDIKHGSSYGCGTADGQAIYMLNRIESVFGSVTALIPSPVAGVGGLGDNPDAASVRLLNNPALVGEPVVEFSLGQSQPVRVSVYDVGGRLVKELADRRYERGTHQVRWSGASNGTGRVRAGVYFIRVRVGADRDLATQRMVLIR